MKIKLICVGKLKEKYLVSACEEYVKRLGIYCNLEIVELAESTLPKEGENILKQLGGYVVPLCIEGVSISSKNLADKIANLGVDGVSQISFIIGSSEGLSEKVKDKADFKLSMSEMTFPHQLSRVMLLEQIYRTFSIINNGKYHK
jgi:23S rRNA (pseudouridine1915-N3)-methyltransferase